MGQVNSVNGVIDSGKLGRTLMHEHFLFGFAGFQGDVTLGGFKEEEYTRDCVQAVIDAREYGVETIVHNSRKMCQKPRCHAALGFL